MPGNRASSETRRRIGSAIQNKPGRPPGMPPSGPLTEAICSLAVSRILLPAALIAAVTRSSSMPMSLGSTTDLSIVTRTTSNWPLTVAVTMPPPAWPSQVIAASSSCTRCTSPWSFCACCISALRSGILGLDIGLDLLDLRAKCLEHVLGDRVLARLDLALAALGGDALARRLEHRSGAAWALRRLDGIEQPNADLDLSQLGPQAT